MVDVAPKSSFLWILIMSTLMLLGLMGKERLEDIWWIGCLGEFKSDEEKDDREAL